jgi:hypothetical protein
MLNIQRGARYKVFITREKQSDRGDDEDKDSEFKFKFEFHLFDTA